MENAIEALKIAFAVIMFVIALSITITMFSVSKETADAVLHGSDMTAYMQYEAVSDADSENRIVGLETVIPTLYKYYKENYTVIFRSGNDFETLYETVTNPDLWSKGYNNKYYRSESDKKKVCSFDVDEETKRHEPWTGSPEKNKEMLDCFIANKPYEYINGETGVKDKPVTWDFTLNDHTKFIENLGEYTYDANNDQVEAGSDSEKFNSGLVKNKKKRVIIYTIID